MAINPLITMGVKPINLDFSDRRLRNAHSDLYEQQADVQRQNIEQEKATMEALKTYGNDITPETVKTVMGTDPKTAMAMQGVLSKQQADKLALDKAASDAEESKWKANAEKYKQGRAKLEDFAKVAGTMKDPVTFYQGLGLAADMGVDAAMINRLADGGYDPQKISQFIQSMQTETAKLDLKEKLERLEFEAKKRPQELKKLENEVITGTPDPVTGLKPSETATNAREQKRLEFERRRVEDLEKGTPGVDIPFSPEVQKQKAQIAAAGRAPAAPAIHLSSEALDMAAAQFAQTGQMPALGMGNTQARTAIINRAAQLAPNVDLAGNKADYAANSNSLKRLIANNDSVTAFESTALKNLDTFLDVAKEVLDTGSPMLNRPLRELSDSVVGSEKQAAFNTAKRVAINEIAKVLTNPGSNAALSDSARKEIEELIKPSATLGQIYAAANLLKRDMENRKTSNDDQIKAIRSRIGSGGAAGGAKPQANRPPLSSFEVKR